MDEFLDGANAVVTGASKGIGLAIAKALLRAGANVAICARNPQGLDLALTELRAGAGARKAVGYAADVGDSGEVAEFFRFADRELGSLDILVNNAGIGVFRPAAELTVEEWDRVIATNLSGAFYCCREALQRFHTKPGGWLINISSLAAKNPFAGGSAYNASKFGLTGLAEAAMLDHRYDNVRVSSILPGSVDTDFSGAGGSRAEWKIAPEDIAQIVLDILRMPTRTLISRVEVRPSRPKKN
ncbi:MAG: SDR family oxidoreductase [Bryobacteraceae bacterium]